MTTFVLGAIDHEMTAIERLVTDAGHPVIYATVDGQRVHGGNAYRASIPKAATAEGGTVYLVECCGDISMSSRPACDFVRLDHHRPGDPGFGLPPQEFLRGSSLGQVISILARQDALPSKWTRSRSENFPICSAGQIGAGSFSDAGKWAVGLPDDPPILGEDVGGFPVAAGWRLAIIPDELVMTAAADHCLGAAYKGECPGVDPDDLLVWTADRTAALRTAASGQTITRQIVLDDIALAREALAAAPILELPGGHTLRDMRAARLRAVSVCGQEDHRRIRFDGGAEKEEWDNGYYHITVSALIPKLPTAAARESVGYVTAVTEPTGRRKIVCGGGTTPETVRAFLAWAKAQSLVDPYGDPARGYAGAYLTDPVAACHQAGASAPAP